METVIENLGRLAAECDLKATSPELLPWERESLTAQAQKYRDAQMHALETAYPSNVARLTAKKIIAEMEEIGQERIDPEPYPYANILGDTRSRSHKRVNRLTIFCSITLILYALCWIF